MSRPKASELLEALGRCQDMMNARDGTTVQLADRVAALEREHLRAVHRLGQHIQTLDAWLKKLDTDLQAIKRDAENMACRAGSDMQDVHARVEELNEQLAVVMAKLGTGR